MKFHTILLFVALFLSSCGDDNLVVDPMVGTTLDPNSWLVPQGEVFDGGPGKDGIPSVDDPLFSNAQDYGLDISNELILGIAHNGIARAYPHFILDWHEIVNDDIGDLSVAVTYCPLTGTGVGWSRILDGDKTSFGVSGLLYNSNLMPYDRKTDSTWSQQRMECVNGELVSEEPETIVLIETTLGTWLESYPDAEIMTPDTGFSRQYGTYPYGDYITNNGRILFPLSNEDSRLPNKERVLGILMGNQSFGVPFSSETNDTEVLHENMAGEDVVIVRNTQKNFITAFMNPEGLDFSPYNGSDGVFQDENDNVYDLSGIIVEGSNVGTRLQQPISFIGYWFSWGTFYPNMDLVGE